MGTCSRCRRALCAACTAWDVDGEPTCEACGRLEEDRSRSIDSTLLVLIGIGYLLTLVAGVVLLHAKPYIGGVAAIVAIALERTLRIVLKPPVVVRRLSKP